MHTTRRGMLRLGAGSALAAGGASLVAPLAAWAVSEEDLALVRLGTSGELLADAFLFQALRARSLAPGERRLLGRARDDDRRHYAVLAEAIGPDAPSFGDFEIGFPPATFRSRGRLLAVGRELKRALVGVHLYAAAAVADAGLRGTVARIAANEASQLAALSRLAGAPPLPALPEPVDEETATAVFAPYWEGR